MSVIVEQGIPIPTKPGRPPKYDFAVLKVGDSFFAPVHPHTLRGCVRRARRRLPGREFVVRAEIHGARCWRTV